jgi:predicted RNase H-like nuclease (RuvC/YqgF family)
MGQIDILEDRIDRLNLQRDHMEAIIENQKARVKELEGHLEVAICRAGKEERLKIEAESRVKELSALLRECMGVMRVEDYEKWETLAPKIAAAL